MTEGRGSGLPLGGTGLDCESYLDFLATEYLSTYIRAGGAAVRFVVTGGEDVTRRWHAGLARAARDEGCRYVAMDAAETKMAMIDQIYATLARTVDWDPLVRRTLYAAWQEVGLPPETESALTATAVATFNDVDVREANRSIRRQLESTLLGDTSLDRQFRLAILRLCQAELGTGDTVEAERAAVLAWLRVEPVALRALKTASISARIGRHSARAMLASLASWLHRHSGAPLVIDLDLHRLAVTRRPPAEERHGFYYTKPALLDSYEVLRQLVDATDHLRGVLVLVTLPPELVTDALRGLPAYSALHLRIVDEVRDKRRANPYAALVRLETRLEVAP